jgi:hypothetical protein
MILKYLDDFGSITPFEAFSELGITKLATRVSEMIRDGQRIKKTLMETKNRYGESVRFMKYEKAV